jgi:cytosine deaminase
MAAHPGLIASRLSAAHAQAGVAEFDACLDLITGLPARLMNLTDYGITPGHPADIVVLDTLSVQGAIAELPDILMGFKDGRRTFERKPAVLFRP